MKRNKVQEEQEQTLPWQGWQGWLWALGLSWPCVTIRALCRQVSCSCRCGLDCIQSHQGCLPQPRGWSSPGGSAEHPPPPVWRCSELWVLLCLQHLSKAGRARPWNSPFPHSCIPRDRGCPSIPHLCALVSFKKFQGRRGVSYRLLTLPVPTIILLLVYSV